MRLVDSLVRLAQFARFFFILIEGTQILPREVGAIGGRRETFLIPILVPPQIPQLCALHAMAGWLQLGLMTPRHFIGILAGRFTARG